MTTWRRASPEALRSLLAGIRDTRWSWQPEDVADLCRRMGWTLEYVAEDMGGFADAGLDVPGDQVTIMFRDGPVGDIKIRVTEVVSDDVSGRDRFMSDAFADAVDEGLAVLGEPTARLHTELPAVRWRGDDSTVLVQNVVSAVTVTWATNAWQDRQDAVAEALA